MRRWVLLALVIMLTVVTTPGLGAEPLPVLRPGSTGTPVSMLQAMLHAAGQAVAVTGTYDEATRKAVAAFQKRSALQADGIAERKTWLALAQASAVEIQDSQLRYTVRPGDTLSEIATRFDLHSAQLATANELADPNQLTTGQRLLLSAGPILPAGDAKVASGVSPQAAPAAAPAAGATSVPAPGPASPGGPTAGTLALENGEAAPVMLYLPTASGETTPAGAQGGEGAPQRSAANGQRIALTFDDMPDSASLPALLDLIKQTDLRATFFLNADGAEAHPDVVRALAAAGQEIESHGYRHQSWVGQSRESQLADLQHAQEVLTGLTGRAPIYYRPPTGAYDLDLLESVNGAHLQMVMWSNISARDEEVQDKAELVDALRAAAFPGAVLMLHASRSATLAALPDLLHALQGAGYRVVPLQALLSTRL